MDMGIVGSLFSAVALKASVVDRHVGTPVASHVWGRQDSSDKATPVDRERGDSERHGRVTERSSPTEIAYPSHGGFCNPARLQCDARSDELVDKTYDLDLRDIANMYHVLERRDAKESHSQVLSTCEWLSFH